MFWSLELALGPPFSLFWVGVGALSSSAKRQCAGAEGCGGCDYGVEVAVVGAGGDGNCGFVVPSSPVA